MKFEEGLALIANENTRVLIMGTFPGKYSIMSNQYYSDKRNDFWKIFGDDFWKITGKVYSKNFTSISYDMRISELQNRGVGLWDVYSNVERKTSLDKDITSFSINDFSRLKERCPNLEKICFNGKLAANYSELFFELGYDTITLPSSSGANRKSQIKRANDWKKELF